MCWLLTIYISILQFFIHQLSALHSFFLSSKQMALLLPKTNFVLAIFLLLLMLSTSKGSLDVHYYHQTCPQAENIIFETVRKASINDPKVPARILRMFFHDCFIRVWVYDKYVFFFFFSVLEHIYIYIDSCHIINRGVMHRCCWTQLLETKRRKMVLLIFHLHHSMWSKTRKLSWKWHVRGQFLVLISSPLQQEML